MPSRSFLDIQPTTPATKHHSVAVVEAHDNATTSPLTNSLGGSPTRTTGERTPEYPLAGAGVMSHYPPSHHQAQQHPPQAATAAAGRDPRYVQMVSAGAPPHFQGHPQQPQQAHHHHPHHAPGGAHAPPPGQHPPQQPQQQHAPHQTYVIAGYPPGHGGHQHGHPPPPGSQYYTVNAVPSGSYPPPPPQGGAYHPHAQQHPPSPHHPHHARPSHHHTPGGPPTGTPTPVYVRHGPPGSAPHPTSPYGPNVMYAQQGPPRGGPHHPPPPMGAVSASTTHSSSVSKASTHPSDKDNMPPIMSGGPDAHMKASHEPPHQSVEDMQAEREKEEIAMEQVLKSVKPIQTDYHLFIEEEMKKTKRSCRQGRRRRPLSTKLQSKLSPQGRLGSFAAFSTSHLLETRELDRKRFMEEEEIASRHCATLTARNSTPTSRKKTQSTAEVTVDEEDEEEEDETRDDPSKRAREKDEPDQNESPVKKERLEEADISVEQQAENVEEV